VDNCHQHVTYMRAYELTIRGRSTHIGDISRVIRVQQLRQKAELLRRVASIPTHGDGLIDRDLLALADQLEEEADVTEEYLKHEPEADELA
jgi:hypothetical protein